ncbi:DUF5686 and carboxypeptidase regulatory-like domain-containing protein [Gelidibacter salicanalis]|uniref:Carboxypeptidase-like regulatory domain-containing protein n=1 Tax=Gelidibacter salicanalis TaxID=291193 RepID=A0A934NIQ2_9FLAO|nr:DUF5686 and carboxypeptidase regulatory-like domain-containing protein [Gelidibacter salicanalis]MBJ7881458.1 carboxypeptidase-like regulatory domain-containing protein [Gelidibacter salicanalis]
MTKHLLPLFFIFISLQAFSQLKGRITDHNNAPLPFVNIYVENSFTGTTSNDEGYYELNLSTPDTYTIVFQFLGYKTVKKKIEIKQFPFTLNATLSEEQISLNEIVINSDENPADIIMRKTIASRKTNLEKINAFKANFYSRGLIRIKNAPEKFFGQELDDFMVGLDSTRSGILYLSETISEIDYMRPDKLKEKIIASKVSGDNNGFSFNTASDVDFNFYNNTIELGNQIISPIADYAFNYYKYKLEGVFYDDKGNLINKIKVIPRRENDRIFSGSIYIVDNQWTIYAVELDITGIQAQIPPAEVITITQNFSYSEKDQIWVIISQGIDFSYSLFGFKGDGRYTAVYSNYNFAPELTKKSFGKEILSFATEANKKDSTYWKSIRPVPLTDEEVSDYLVKDSIQSVRESRPYLDSIDAKNNAFKMRNILFGYSHRNSFEDWSIGYSSPLSDFQFNTVQGYNSKLNFYYRKNQDEYRRYFAANAALQYGVSDERLRATASFRYKFNNISKHFLTVSGGVKTQQFNEAQPISPLVNSISSLFFEDNYMKIYDKSFAEVGYSQEVSNGITMYSTLAYERRKALVNTTDQVFFNDENDAYTSNNPLNPNVFGVPAFNTHHLLKFNLNARFNFGQDYLSYPDSKINIPNSDYPTLFLGYEKGFAASEQQYNFDQLKLRLTQSFNVGNKGDFKYNLKAGTFFNAEAIGFMDYYHPNGNQTHVGTSSSYLNVFNNLPYYALSTNNSYLEMHAEHDFKGLLLSRVPLLNKLNYNLVIGAHGFATEHQKPYQEYTIGLDNIGFKKFRFLRVDYVRSYQNGYQGDAVIFGLKFLNILE